MEKLSDYFTGRLTVYHYKTFSQYILEWHAISDSKLSEYLTKNDMYAIMIDMGLADNILKLGWFESTIKSNREASKLVNDVEKEFLDLLAYASLCFLIGYIIKDQDLNADPLINLVAAPSLGKIKAKKDYHKLIKYYESIGFSVNEVEPLTVQEFLDKRQQVNMQGNSEHIINICREKAKMNIDVGDIKIVVRDKRK